MAQIARAKRRRVTVPGVNEPSASLSSNCFVVGDFVIITGLTARDVHGRPAAQGDPFGQSVVLLNRMKALMEAAGGTMSDVVKLSCFLTDIRYRDGFVRARQEFFSGDFPPCTLVGGVAFTDPELLVEVDAWAILGSGD